MGDIERGKTILENLLEDDIINVRPSDRERFMEDWRHAMGLIEGSACQAPASGEVEPVVWLVKFKEYEGRFEFAEPYEKATNPEYWTDAFPVYTHPPAKVPEGWKLCRESGDRITIDADGLGFYVARIDAERIADIMLYALANDLLTTPTPAATPETEWVKCSSCGNFAYECDVCGGKPTTPQEQ